LPAIPYPHALCTVILTPPQQTIHFTAIRVAYQSSELNQAHLSRFHGFESLDYLRVRINVHRFGLSANRQSPFAGQLSSAGIGYMSVVRGTLKPACSAAFNK
jgi:hypothetical protein